jgi:hypothetical protein
MSALNQENGAAWKRRHYELQKHIGEGQARRWYEYTTTEQALIIAYYDAHAQAMLIQQEIDEQWEPEIAMCKARGNQPALDFAYKMKWGEVTRRSAYSHIMRTIEESLKIRFDDENYLVVNE